MLDNYFVLSYLCLIIALQSSAGVGILVLGTPFLLLIGYNIVDIFFLLLPLSILTSFLNMIIMKLTIKKIEPVSLKELFKFFIACVPSIIVGLFILKFFQEYINFKFLVSIIIICSILLVMLKDKISYKINFFRISILSIVGVIHGLTNSGGTLMSLILSTDKQKVHARYSITIFYLLLALIQYGLINFIFKGSIFFLDYVNLITVLFIGILLGNLFINFLSENKYKLLINFLAILSSIFLLLF